jgi:acetyl-CoA acyltransferase
MLYMEKNVTERIAVIDGVRTPFGRRDGVLKGWSSEDLAALVTRELIARSPFLASDIDEVIIGNVAQPIEAANIARVIASLSQIPAHVPAMTVHRNCASGMEALTTACNKLHLKQAQLILAGGTESMSQMPFVYRKEAVEWFLEFSKSKTVLRKVKNIFRFRPKMLLPINALEKALIDPICGLNMGQTAEILAQEFGISRKEQDAYALQSHLKAEMSQAVLREEIYPIPYKPGYNDYLLDDTSVRKGQTMQALSKLTPCFQAIGGSVTAGNSCPISDGAVVLLLMREVEAKERNLPVLGYIRETVYTGLEGRLMGLGPSYAIAKLFKESSYCLDDFDLFEMNEAFAAQILANCKLLADSAACQKYLSYSEAIGELPIDKLNVNGGAIALGHPVGASGARLILTLLKELKRRELFRGLATLCVGGGQGAAFVVEVDS